MPNSTNDRRGFLKGALVGTSVAMTSGVSTQALAADKPQAMTTNTDSQGYIFFNLEEQEWIERLVNHMIPADKLSPKGTDLGVHFYIDRALAGGWGKGDRLYQAGPWKKGLPTQGYQLPLTPANLYKVSIEQSNQYCQKKDVLFSSRLPLRHHSIVPNDCNFCIHSTSHAFCNDH